MRNQLEIREAVLSSAPPLRMLDASVAASASAFLRKLSSGGFLPNDDQDLLRSLYNDIRSFDARENIIREGERPEFVHLMVEGWACRSKTLQDGSRQITAFLVPGDFCDSHITLFDKMDHAIIAVTQSEVAFIPREKMLEILDRPHITRALWWASLVDEAVLRTWIVNLGRRNAYDRVGHLICELHARLQHVGLVHDNKFELPLTQEELGDALGLTAVHINRILKRLRDDDLVTHVHRQIKIRDLGRLQHSVGFDANYLHLRQVR